MIEIKKFLEAFPGFPPVKFQTKFNSLVNKIANQSYYSKRDNIVTLILFDVELNF